MDSPTLGNRVMNARPKIFSPIDASLCVKSEDWAFPIFLTMGAPRWLELAGSSVSSLVISGKIRRITNTEAKNVWIAK